VEQSSRREQFQSTPNLVDEMARCQTDQGTLHFLSHESYLCLAQTALRELPTETDTLITSAKLLTM
jgi:hypothetical protein